MIRARLAKRRSMRDHRFTHAHLSDYLDDELAPRERARVQEHVRWCPECRRVLESLTRTVTELMGLRDEPSDSVAPRVIDRLRRDG